MQQPGTGPHPVSAGSIGVDPPSPDSRRTGKGGVSSRSVAFLLLAVASLIACYALLSRSPSSVLHRQGKGAAALSSKVAPPVVKPVELIAVARESAQRANAALPFVPGPLRAMPPFSFPGGADDFDRAAGCLAAAGIYEAGDDPVGERGVMQVVLNRVRHPAFPKTVCGVVFQGAERSTGCQFTFTCDGAMARIVPQAAWDRSLALAAAALRGAVDKGVGNATHYHTDWVVPYWQTEMEKLAFIGGHLFFRWRGYWGTYPSFAGKVAGVEPYVPRLAARVKAHVASVGAEVLPMDLAGLENALEATSDGATVAANAPVRRYYAFAGPNEAFVSAREAGSALLVQVRPGVLPGRYAMAALRLCPENRACHILGWLDGAALPAGLPVAAETAAKLSFVFLQRGGGNDLVLWDCDTIPQAAAVRCLPKDIAGRLQLVNGSAGPVR